MVTTKCLHQKSYQPPRLHDFRPTSRSVSTQHLLCTFLILLIVLNLSDADKDPFFGRFEVGQKTVEEVIYAKNSDPTTFIGCWNSKTTNWARLVNVRKQDINMAGEKMRPSPRSLGRPRSDEPDKSTSTEIEAEKLRKALVVRRAADAAANPYSTTFAGDPRKLSVDGRMDVMWKEVMYNMKSKHPYIVMLR
jgi:hypothetical protein